jgi:hypothetical protein
VIVSTPLGCRVMVANPALPLDGAAESVTLLLCEIDSGAV